MNKNISACKKGDKIWGYNIFNTDGTLKACIVPSKTYQGDTEYKVFRYDVVGNELYDSAWDSLSEAYHSTTYSHILGL